MAYCGTFLQQISVQEETEETGGYFVILLSWRETASRLVPSSAP